MSNKENIDAVEDVARGPNSAPQCQILRDEETDKFLMESDRILAGGKKIRYLCAGLAITGFALLVRSFLPFSESISPEISEDIDGGRLERVMREHGMRAELEAAEDYDTAKSIIELMKHSGDTITGYEAWEIAVSSNRAKRLQQQFYR